MNASALGENNVAATAITTAVTDKNNLTLFMLDFG